MSSSTGMAYAEADWRVVVVRRSVPKEVIEVHAYFKWLRRCQMASCDVHGFDKEHWYEAERELEGVWNTADPQRKYSWPLHA